MRTRAVRLLIILAVLSAGIVSALYLSGLCRIYVLIPLLFLGCYLLLFFFWILPFGIALLFIDKKKPMEGRVPLIDHYAKYVASFVLLFSRVDLKVSGLEMIPDESFLMVGNHRSFLDPVVEIGVMLNLRNRKVGFVAKKELLDAPVVGRFFHSLQCLALNRGVLKEELKTILLAARLVKEQKACIGIYPEGTRNPGDGLLPFKSGSFRIAEKAKSPIVVAVIHNSDQVKHNFPLKDTRVHLELVGVLDRDFVASHNSAQISETVRSMMEAALPSPAAA